MRVCLDTEHITRVYDQNGVSLLYVMLVMHHSGREPSITTHRLEREVAAAERWRW